MGVSQDAGVAPVNEEDQQQYASGTTCAQRGIDCGDGPATASMRRAPPHADVRKGTKHSLTPVSQPCTGMLPRRTTHRHVSDGAARLVRDHAAVAVGGGVLEQRRVPAGRGVGAG